MGTPALAEVAHVGQTSAVMPRADATVLVAGVAVLVLLTPLRRLLGAPGMPFWSLFVVWALVVAGAFWANRAARRR